MTIPSILPVNNDSSELLKRGSLGLITVIFFILGTGVSLFAQNVIIRVYDPENLALKSSSLLLMRFPGLETNLYQPPQIKTPDYYISLLFQPKVTVLAKSGKAETKDPGNAPSNSELFRAFYNKPPVDEKIILRKEWEEAFGFDVWSPYYKYKDIERLVKRRLSVKVYQFKGEPRVEKDKIFYVFAATF